MLGHTRMRSLEGSSVNAVLESSDGLARSGEELFSERPSRSERVHRDAFKPFRASNFSLVLARCANLFERTLFSGLLYSLFAALYGGYFD